jgi:signal transduction histidine kinase
MVAASVVLAVLVGSAFAVLRDAMTDAENLSDLSRHSQEVLVAANEVERLVIDLETGERGFIITRDDRFLEPWRSARARLPAAEQRLGELTEVPAQRARSQRLLAAVEAYVSDYSVPLVDAVRRGSASAGDASAIADGKARVDALRARFDDLIAAERRLAASRQDRSERAARRAVLAASAGLTGSIALIAFFAAYLTRAIVLPVRRASRMAGELAAGDLSVRMPETSPAEIGALERSFNTMAGSLEQSRAELTASRARVVAAADDARRRIERDLHDGIQQRLVSLGLDVRAAEAAAATDGDARTTAQLAGVAKSVASLVEDLQEVSRGIHPAILSKGGLGPALRTLARRAGLPVDVDVRVDGRFPEPVEVAAYYVVSEALTNAAKHAQATRVTVTVDTGDRGLELHVVDDGVGGADLGGGSGLVGLRDRVEAVGGRLEVASPRGEGTSLHVTVPLRSRAG